MAIAEREQITTTHIELDDEMLRIYDGLYDGLREKKDPVTWRTLVVDLRRLLGGETPDCKPAVEELFENAYGFVSSLVDNSEVEPMIPEILRAVGEFDDLIEETREGLDALLFNGRHFPEPLLWTLADELRDKGLNIAVVNPVGHYNDGETRIVAPHLGRPVDHFIIVASTQSEQGGSMEVLTKVIGVLRSPDYATYVREVDVVIPMFGGSRGHRLGQDNRVGFEVLEAKVNAKFPALLTQDFLDKVSDEIEGDGPIVRFISVDIHNDEYPQGVFVEGGMEFISADPTPELADEAYEQLKKREYLNLPLKVIACDEGAVPRTENMARAFLFHPQNRMKTLDVIYIDKARLEAGMVDESKTKIVRVERWRLTRAMKIVRAHLPVPTIENPSTEKCVILFSDDMLDTGGTARDDMHLTEQHYPNTCLRIFAATHPILSKGIQALDKVGADIYLFGNTLKQTGLLGRDDVEIVEMAPAIARAILGSDS
jgi:phosphoribosylpyrophosphate synthetase